MNNNRTTELDHQANILEVSLTSDMSFDSTQTAFAKAFRMLDFLPPCLDNSQEQILKLDPESGPSTHLASGLSLPLEDSQGLDTPQVVFYIIL